jgi:AraC-like DNA-binding protein
MPSDLAELALRYSTANASARTPVPALQVVRADRTGERVHAVHRPSLCLLAQGAKEVTVGTTVFRYRSPQYLFSSVDLPVTGAVIEATRAEPYLCLALEIDASVVFELASAGAAPVGANGNGRAIFVGESDARMTGAFARLLECLEHPRDVAVLAPSVMREITYRLLQGPYGDCVRDLGVPDSQTQRIAKAIEHLKRGFAQSLRVEALARIAGMSVSSFHQHFKQVTTLSPLQYQKRLRLQEARRLLLSREAGAADVGFTVGYESPSQFSREYARLFGLPPMQDVTRALTGAPSAPRAAPSRGGRAAPPRGGRAAPSRGGRAAPSRSL